MVINDNDNDSGTRSQPNLAGNFVSTLPRVVTLKSPVAFQRARALAHVILCIFDAFGRIAASLMCLIIVIRSLILYTHLFTCMFFFDSPVEIQDIRRYRRLHHSIYFSPFKIIDAVNCV